MSTQRKDDGGEVVTLPTAAVVAKAIKDAVAEISPLRASNTSNNARVREIKSALEGVGITKRAFERAYQDAETYETEGGQDSLRAQRLAEDTARDAMGVGQLDLFDKDSDAAAAE